MPVAQQGGDDRQMPVAQQGGNDRQMPIDQQGGNIRSGQSIELIYHQQFFFVFSH